MMSASPMCLPHLLPQIQLFTFQKGGFEYIQVVELFICCHDLYQMLTDSKL